MGKWGKRYGFEDSPAGVHLGDVTKPDGNCVSDVSEGFALEEVFNPAGVSDVSDGFALEKVFNCSGGVDGVSAAAGVSQWLEKDTFLYSKNFNKPDFSIPLTDITDTGLSSTSISVKNIGIPQQGTDIADTLLSGDADFWNHARVLCQKHEILTSMLAEKVSESDISDYKNGDLDLEAYVCLVVENEDKRRGIAPKDYKSTFHCEQCGPVPHWRTGKAAGCVWCSNRIGGLPIPRTTAITCGTCRHAIAGCYSYMRRCGINQRQPLAGQQATDRHFCEMWLPAVPVKRI